MEELLAGGAPWPGAVAVSGGGDSIALMHLLARWARSTRRAPPIVLTVDHGLRETSGADSRKVVRWAKAAKLKAHGLRWNGPRPASDIEAAARAARYRLMAERMRKHRIAALYVAHTRDDQAETFLLRLMRGSGLDGLSAMQALAPYPVGGFQELCVVRPLLALEREAVRDHLTAKSLSWLDDPMNADDRFARVRLRRLLPLLEEAGISRDRIAGAAAHLARARESLDEVTLAVLGRAAHLRDGIVHVDGAALTAAPREIGLRALARLLMSVSGQSYRPRFERLERLFDTIRKGTLGGGATLHGCYVTPVRGAPGTLAIQPEPPRRRGKKTRTASSA